MSRNWKWNIRHALPTDIDFIYSTWLNTVWNHSDYKGLVDKKVFYDNYPKVIDRILEDKETKTIVACAHDNENTVFGYLVATPPTAHFVNVKSIFQKYGIAKSLFQHLKCGNTVSHCTGTLFEIQKKHPEIKYNPFLLFNSSKGDQHGASS